MNKARMIYKNNPVYKLCPSCKEAGKLHKSHSRNLLEKLIKNLSFFGIYRCTECGWRGYLSNLRFTFKMVKYLLLYILLFIITLVVVSRLIRFLF